MFVTSAIPVPGARTEFGTHPSVARLGFDTETALECSDWTVKTRIEMDFFNGNTTGAFGSFPIRLRFAWIDVGPFLIGQALIVHGLWRVPNVLDWTVPGGMVLVGQADHRCPTLPSASKDKVAFGIEQPYWDIQSDASR